MLANRRIAKLREARDVYGLIVALWHKRQRVRRRAAAALGALDDRRAVAPLIGALDDDKASVRLEAARALGRLRDPRAAEPLVAATSDRSRPVRLASIRAIDRDGAAQITVLDARGAEYLAHSAPNPIYGLP